ncbi:alpha/beta hydrolase [Colwellia sp. Bg11-28]|uniref:alpha/beta hydrolase n=1 Tax=Colwellia sp. Bg11-28 TaxID=2058305 RepID=UPI000C325612|nr:alpha/beta hydrolase-fold protein [Colwellia sp. Bg11-28]PKH86038.1 esterase [Colwellia sp. Bg11-28]
MKKYIIVFMLCLLAYSAVGKAASLGLGDRVSIDSKVLSTDRELQVLLPENYFANTQATYPVIYLIDGDYNFHGVSGMLDLLANKGQLIPDVILVGIADKGTSQYHEYMTPSVFDSKAKPSKGKAAKFIRFITEEVKPYIDNNYRSAESSTLVGHSMGGLFVLNMLLEKPSAFNNYVAISPSVWVADQGIVAKAKEKLSKAQHKPVSLFLSLADETRMGQYDFINALDLTQPNNINWQFKHYPDENHNSVGIIALRDSLKAIYKPWYIVENKLATFKTPESIVQHYQTIMTEFGFSQPMPSTSVQEIFRRHYRNKNAASLPTFIEETIKKLPASKQALITMQAKYVAHFDSPKASLPLLIAVEKEFSQSIDHLKAIASTYEKLEDNGMAHEYYQKALVLAEKQKANQWQFNIINAKLVATK